MTKTDLETIFASQMAVGTKTVFFMLYESNGNGGTKCEVSNGSLADLDTLATTLADYTYVDPSQSPVGMVTFVSKDCTVEITPVIQTAPVPMTSESVSASQIALASVVAAPTTTDETVTQPTVTGTVTKDDGTTYTVTTEATPETTAAAADSSTTAAPSTDTSTASTSVDQGSTSSAS